MKKQVLYWIHFLCLLTGILMMNYLINEHTEYTKLLIYNITSTKKLMNLNLKMAFTKVFLKRISQFAVIRFLCVSISQYYIYLMWGFHSWMFGMIQSILYFYEGLSGSIAGMGILFFIFIHVKLIEIVNPDLCKKKENCEKIHWIREGIGLIILTIITAIFEFSVIYFVFLCFLNNR